MGDLTTRYRVATAALSAGVSQGMEAVTQGSSLASSAASTVARSMISNAAAQGIGVATGLQDRFRWASVAAAGIRAGVGYGMEEALGMHKDAYAMAGTAERLGKSTLAGMAGGVTATLARDGRVSVVQVVGDAFGNAIGNIIVEHGWSGTARGSSMTAQEDFRRSEIIAMNQAALGEPSPAALAFLNSSVAGLGVGISQLENPVDRLQVSLGSPNGADVDPSQVPSATTRFVQDYMVRNPTASYEEVQQAYDQAWAEQSDAHLLRQARESYASAGNSWTLTGTPDNSSLRVVGETADGGLIWNTGTVSRKVASPEIYVSELPAPEVAGTGLIPPPSLLRRFGLGLLGAIEGVTAEPVRQLSDLGKAGTSVFYNEVIRKDGAPYWFPELTSNTANAYANGTSQTKLILGSIPLLNVGVTSYEATTALMQGRYGDAAELGGGIAGGFVIGKGVSRYGEYGVTIDNIGATGLRASQAGAIGLKIIKPNRSVGTAELNAPELDRNLWKITLEGTEQVLQNNQFGKFYKSASDGLWWSKDNAGHGGSEWKVFQETAKGLQWYRDANMYGDFIDGKHKGDTGKFVPWNKLNGSGF